MPLLAGRRGALIQSVNKEHGIAFLGKVLQLTGLILVGMGLMEGLFGKGLGMELRLSAAGAVLFFIGWLFDRKLARRG